MPIAGSKEKHSIRGLEATRCSHFSFYIFDNDGVLTMYCKTERVRGVAMRSWLAQIYKAPKEVKEDGLWSWNWSYLHDTSAIDTLLGDVPEREGKVVGAGYGVKVGDELFVTSASLAVKTVSQLQHLRPVGKPGRYYHLSSELIDALSTGKYSIYLVDPQMDS